MSETIIQNFTTKPSKAPRAPATKKEIAVLKQHVVEIISDSGEGAQRCGQALGTIAARQSRTHDGPQAMADFRDRPTRLARARARS